MFSEMDLTQASRTLRFIQSQLAELSRNCGTVLQDDLGSFSYFMELEDKLEKLLHETRAACRPPPRRPVKADFDLIKPIASGAFGTVNLVRHKETRRVFALKQIRLEEEDQRDEVLLERDILAFLDSPLVVSLFCSFETNDHMYMLMEYVAGGDVGTLLKHNKRFHVDVSRFYIAEVVLALEYIHSHGIIHGDLKPANLLITTTGHIKLADFGLSKSGSVTMAACLTEEDCKQLAREFPDDDMGGTPEYLAPEVSLGTGFGKPIDWWATGIILYKFLYGVPPFRYVHDNMCVVVEEVCRQVTEDEVPWPDTNPPLPQDVQSLVYRLLDKTCETRLGTRGACEVKGHPFFRAVDWSNLLNQKTPYVPELDNEEDTRCFQGCPQLLSNVSPHGGDVQVGSPVEPTDFCYVAYRFKEEYGSPLPLSPQQPVNSELVEEQEPNSTEPTVMDDSTVDSTEDNPSEESTEDNPSEESTEDNPSEESTEENPSKKSTMHQMGSKLLKFTVKVGLMALNPKIYWTYNEMLELFD